MKTGLASSIEPIALAQVNSEAWESSANWIQPSVSNLTLLGGQIPVTGELIDGVYLVPHSPDDSDDEMEGLVAAYDEAKSHPIDAMTLDEAVRELEQKRRQA